VEGENACPSRGGIYLTTYSMNETTCCIKEGEEEAEKKKKRREP